MKDSAPPKRCWYQYSLRTLPVVVLSPTYTFRLGVAHWLVGLLGLTFVVFGVSPSMPRGQDDERFPSPSSERR